MNDSADRQYYDLAEKIKLYGKELGFADIGISNLDLQKDKEFFEQWLNKKFNADMEYMSANKSKRTSPSELHPGTLSVITCRLNYFPANNNLENNFCNTQNGYISRYALGRDYHKVLKKKLKQLETFIRGETENLGSRFFVDSAPVLERALARKSGIGWLGKNSMLIDTNDGSFFFLGELFVNIPLPSCESETESQCGNCSACMKICPTTAIVSPYIIDSNKCISYQTIENKGSIPVEIRPLIGNRIYGCDDCQLICPWNKKTELTKEKDFLPREQFLNQSLNNLFLWTEEEFLKNTEGTAIRRIGYERWIRNIAVAIGNSEKKEGTSELLKSKLGKISSMVDEHIDWAIKQQSSILPKTERLRKYLKKIGYFTF
ncbi:MAG: tRNA epoxyqueuosine(34) reductase QueG [Rhodothermaceae bacterium]